MLAYTFETLLMELGYAGPFTLGEAEFMASMLAFVSSHREPGRFANAFWRLFGCDRRLQQRNGHLAFEPLFKLIAQPQLLDDVERALGPDLLLWKGRIIIREPGSSGQSWHVDLDNKRVHGLHATIALTAMTERNGALQLIPGTHRYDVSLHKSACEGRCCLSDAASLVRLADETHPENGPHRLVTMELQPGQYFFTMGGLWHGVLPNQTSSRRTAVIARYMRPDVQSKLWSHYDGAEIVENEKSLPCILVRGEDRHRLNRLCRPPKR